MKPEDMSTLAETMHAPTSSEGIWREAYENLLYVLDNIDADVFVIDMESHEILFMNKHSKDSFGGDYLGKTCYQAFRGERAACSNCTNEKLLDENRRPSGVCTWEGQNPITGKWYINHDRAIKWKDDRYVRLEVSVDVSRLKQAEKNLNRQKGYLAALHETTLGLMSRLDANELLEAIMVRSGNLVGAPDGLIYLYDSDNHDLELRFGIGFYDDMVGFRLKHGEGLAGKVWEKNEAVMVEDYSTWEGRHPDPRFDNLHSAVAVPLKSGTHFHGVIGLAFLKMKRKFTDEDLDILSRFAELASIALDNAHLCSKLQQELAEHHRTQAEREKLESQLLHAQKMESIGTLAGGIAHDFNNLLMAIQGNVSLLLLNTDRRHPNHEKLRNIEQQIQSGALLTKQLLGFAKGGKYEVRPTNLNELIARSSELFGRTKKEIRIYSDFQEGLLVVEGDQGQIEQVLMNLYVNAWQAMPDGGDLFLKTRNVTLSKEEAGPHHREPGKYVQVSVRDTGIGMDESTLEKIFDPFFTTKEIGRGTGLGLASVYGIIENHGGFVKVQSVKDQGSTFEIYLPAAKGRVSAIKMFSSGIVGGGETILLVDDEDVIIEMGAEVLKKLGYRVITAREGEEALSAYREHKDEIDLVILDIVMPGISGCEIYRKLRDMDPDIRVLLSSGFRVDEEAGKIMRQGCQGFIEKPFRLTELSRILREIFDREEE